jgi:PcfJ-like protein
MIENTSVRIELLKDEKGIYGIAPTGLPQSVGHIAPIIIRPDRISEDDWATDRALQMIPSKRFGTSSAEHRLMEAVSHSWAAESAKKMGLDRLPPKYYFALRQRSRRIVNSLIREALAVANPEYLKTARRYPILYRYPIYSACCLYGERANQIANTFPAAAIAAYGRLYDVYRTMAGTGRVDETVVRAKCDEIFELIQKGARLRVIAEALKLPKVTRHVQPANVSVAPWNCFRLNPEWLSYMPRTVRKQRRWLDALSIASNLKTSSEFQAWLAYHALELPGSRQQIRSRLGDLSDWLSACRDASNRLDLESLRSDFEMLKTRAQALGKNASRFESPFQAHRGAQFVTRSFTPNMSLPTVQKLCDDWHQTVSMSKFSGQDTTFPEPRYEGGEIRGYTITPIRSCIELFREGRAMHNCCLTYADRIMSGTCFFYSVTKNGERYATLMIRDEAGQTVLGDLRTVCNGMADRKLKTAVNEWLRRNQRLYGNGNRADKCEVNQSERYRPEDDEMAFFERVLNG